MSESFLASLGPLTESINRTLLEIVGQEDNLLSQVALYGLKAGGKRLRPIIFCFSCQALGRDIDGDVLKQSITFELLHLATLFHDDIVDMSDLRRGKPSAHKAFSIAEAVLAGDYLLARAAEVAVTTENIACFKTFIRIIRDLSLGELDQIKTQRLVDMDKDLYLSIIYRKTAGLMEGLCQTAGLWLNAQPAKTKALAEFGRKLGLAFQIVDDILDYRGQAGRLGKPVAQDLDEGRITLPFILARDRLPKSDQNRLLELGRRDCPEKAEKQEIIALVTQGHGLDLALNAAEELVNQGIEILAVFPQAPRQSMAELARSMVIRDF